MRFVAETVQGGEGELVDVVDCVFVVGVTGEIEFGS